MTPSPAKRPHKHVRVNRGKPRPPKITEREKRLRLPERRCSASVKQCRKCNYRYPKGDNWHKTPNCPKCGHPHRCPQYVYHNTQTCRMHGGPGIEKTRATHGRATEFRIAHQIVNVYNKVIGDPQLLSLTMQVAVLVSRFEELMRMLDNLDTRGNHEEIIGSLGDLEGLLAEAEANRLTKDPRSTRISLGVLRGIVTRLRSAVEPVRIEASLWNQIYFNIEATRRASETERRFLLLNETMVPMQHVVEAMVHMERLTLKYVRTPEDRAAYGAELRRLFPIEAVAVAALDRPS